MKGKLAEYVLSILTTVAVLALIAVSFFLANRSYEVPSYTGKVANKFSQRVETIFGSRVEYFLIVEEKSGKRLQIRVNERLYQQAQVGMEVEKPADALEPRLSIQNR